MKSSFYNMRNFLKVLFFAETCFPFSFPKQNPTVSLRRTKPRGRAKGARFISPQQYKSWRRNYVQRQSGLSSQRGSADRPWRRRSRFACPNPRPARRWQTWQGEGKQEIILLSSTISLEKSEASRWPIVSNTVDGHINVQRSCLFCKLLNPNWWA